MKLLYLIAMSSLLALNGCTYSSAQGTPEAGKPDQVAAEANEKGTDGDKEMNLETATFAGGCFWCTEAVFLQLKGVEKVLPGYMGGHVKNPTYEQVCDKTTGHAEVIQIQFNPDEISYEDLLFIFFKTHDPTTLNRQGNDVGPQYRSAVFYHSDEQKEKATEISKKIDEAGIYGDPVVTEITEASTMYVAEDYHINYFNKNPNNGYCRMMIPGKLEKLKKLFGDKLKAQPK